MSTIISKKLSYIKNRAKSKSIKFDLDEAWYESKIKKQVCEVSGIPFDFENIGPYTASIDRIDNSKGYTKDNCKIILWSLNTAKGQSTYEELYKISIAFIKKFEKDNKL